MNKLKGAWWFFTFFISLNPWKIHDHLIYCSVKISYSTVSIALALGRGIWNRTFTDVFYEGK